MLKLIPFQHSHLTDFTPNEHAKGVENFNTLGNPECHKWTVLAENGKPLAFIFYREMNPGEFAAFFSISTDFQWPHCRSLRNFVKLLVEQHGAQEVWTASRQGPELEKWHRFMGLHKDGTMEIEGETLDVWRLIWE
jgi:hypothetical protein